MTITVSYNPKEVCFQAKADGKTIGNFPDVFVAKVPFINADDKAGTTRTLQRLFDEVKDTATPGWEAHQVSNQLLSAISRSVTSKASAPAVA